MGYPNSGTLFKNDMKTTYKHPDLNGSAEVNGVKFYVSAWLKEGKNSGKKFYSLSFKEAGQKEEDRSQVVPEKENDKTDDMPW